MVKKILFLALLIIESLFATAYIGGSVYVFVSVYVCDYQLILPGIVDSALSLLIFFPVSSMIKILNSKERNKRFRKTKKLFITCLLISSLLFISSIVKYKIDHNSLDKIVEYISAQCPVKYENGEMSSVKLIHDTLMIECIFYEYREHTIDMLRQYENELKDDMIMDLHNMRLDEILKGKKVVMQCSYKGNRSGEVVSYCIQPNELLVDDDSITY